MAVVEGGGREMENDASGMYYYTETDDQITGCDKSPPLPELSSPTATNCQQLRPRQPISRRPTPPAPALLSGLDEFRLGDVTPPLPLPVLLLPPVHAQSPARITAMVS